MWLGVSGRQTDTDLALGVPLNGARRRSAPREPEEREQGACRTAALRGRKASEVPAEVLPDGNDEFQQLSRTHRNGLGEILVASQLPDPELKVGEVPAHRESGLALAGNCPQAAN